MRLRRSWKCKDALKMEHTQGFAGVRAAKNFLGGTCFHQGVIALPAGLPWIFFDFLCFVCVSEEPWRRGIRRRRRGVWKTGKMRRCVRGDICVQGDAAGVKEAASLLTSLVSQNTSMMTLVPAEKRAPRGTESLELVESPTYRGNQASICSSLLLLSPLHRSTCVLFCVNSVQ